MKKNNKGISLPLAMGLVMIMTLLAFAILEYIIPFSREIKGVENASNAYYQANSGIEEGLYYVYDRNNSGGDYRDEDSTDYTLSMITRKYNTYSSGNILPPEGEGNSEFDDDDNDGVIDHNRNIISSGNPIQLSVGDGYIAGGFEIAFRVPNLDKFGNDNENESLIGTSDSTPIVNWQLSGNGETLNASGSIIKGGDILDSEDDFEDNNIFMDALWNKEGVKLDGTPNTILIFYGANCLAPNKCVLKFSIVNKLELGDDVFAPYLEWQLKTNGGILPLRYTKIESSGKSYGYKKDLEVKVAGQTVNEAYDFTVFQ